MAGLVYLFFILLGLLLLISTIVIAVRKKSVVAGVMSLCFMVSAIGLAIFGPLVSSYGSKTILTYRFDKNRSTYEQIISDVRQNPPIQAKILRELSGEFNNVRYRVDLGPPIRVAFPQPGGLLDNWEGIVYDPTGEVDKAKGWKIVDGQQVFTAPYNIVNLFGDKVLYCEQMEEAYYRCWFT